LKSFFAYFKLLNLAVELTLSQLDITFTKITYSQYQMTNLDLTR